MPTHQKLLFKNPLRRRKLGPRPAAPTEPQPRQRRSPEERLDPRFADYARRVKGNAYQARFWLGQRLGGSLNLGIFTRTEWGEYARWRACQASVAFRRYYNPVNPERTLRKTIDHLKRTLLMGVPLIPASVLPPRVKRGADGLYFARVHKAGRVLETPDRFEDPWDAYEAMLKALAVAFPARSPGDGNGRRQVRARGLQKLKLSRTRARAAKALAALARERDRYPVTLLDCAA